MNAVKWASRASFALVVCLSVGCGQGPDTENLSQPSKRDAPALGEVKPGPNTYFVQLERVQRRTCPKMTCGEVGWISERQVVEALETKSDWVRITNYYDAACEAGISGYVDAGNRTCTKTNGIVDGRFAEWVPLSALGKERPADAAETASNYESLVAQSDDFRRHRVAFTKVARDLIDQGRCTEADFIEQGGWVKSVTQYREEPVYFTYCGGMTSSNKIYMNAETEEIL